MAPSFSKPETVLKQAESLLSVNQPHAALQILSEMFTSKRFRSTPVTSLEPIMIRFMELCVELRKGRAAKEGLMQFKNLAQNTNVGSVEVVVGSFVGMAEGKVREVREGMRRAAAKEKEEKEKEGEVVDDVEDLEAPSTPESILLSSVSSSSTSTTTDRTSRTLLTPALKFLWETYRTSLETLKNNARLELIYQSVAKKAFRFCLENGRKTEFRRLCEMLRMHLVNVGKWQQIQNQNALAAGGGGKDGGGGVRDSGNQINLGDAETLERHLETRFGQLNVSVELELWQEAFRSIEDIHNLLTIAASSTPTSSSSSTLTSTTPGAQNATTTTTTTTTAGSTSLTIKSTMIANYYEKLSQVFLMSGNALYHAAAWAKYYELLTVGSEHTLKHDQRSILAGKVVVSALAVPITAGGANEVHPRLSALLNLPEPSSHSSSSISTSSTAPTRTSLLASLLSSDILPLAPKTVQDLYRALQVEFDPLGLADNVGPLLRELAGEDEHEAEEDEDEEKDGKGQGRWTNKEIYGRYIPLLHDAVLDRLLRGLGEVYSEVRIEDVVRMVSPLERGFGGVGGETGKKTLESYIDSYIVSLAKKGEMGIRIDHREHAILFIDEGLALGSDEAHAASSSSSSASTTTSNPPYLPSTFPAFSSIASNASGSVQPSPTSLVRTRLSAVAGCLDVASRALGVVQRARLQDASTSAEAHAQSEEFPSVETLIAYRKSLLLHQSLTFRRRQLNQELQARAQAQSMSVAAENARRAKEQARLLSLVEAREREAARRKAELEQIRRNEAEKYAKGLLEGGMGGILKGMGKEGREAVEKLTSPSSTLDHSSLLKMQLLALERDKSLRLSRLKTISKRLDHLTRAFRISELPLLSLDYSTQLEQERAQYERRAEEARREARERWEEGRREKERLGRGLDGGFRKDWEERREVLVRRKGEEFALRREKAMRRIESEKAKRLEEFMTRKREREEKEAKEKELRERLECERAEQARLAREQAEEEERAAREEAEAAEREQRQREQKEKEDKDKAEREKEEKRKERERERERVMEQARMREMREEEAERRRVERKEKERMERLEQTQTQRKETGTAAAAPLAGGAWRRSTTTTTTTSSSNTPLSSVPGTPTRQRTEGPTRSESPAPASQGKYVPGALGASRGGWRAREEAKANAAASGVSVSREGGGGTNSNVPSRTASPAPAPPKGDDDDGFTVVGGDKKGSSTGGAAGGSGVWKARRGGGMGGRSGR
ncbi:hypothetical protein FB446DRAFT_382437 [Lentinula raphanica]|nr:hypothetical protein FB446DRAFT_382437 [Lentinula raphanica]